MKMKPFIRVSTVILVLVLAFSLISASAIGSNYVIVNNKTAYDTTATYSGSATSYTARTDNFSVGYYVDNGKIDPDKSLLDKSGAAVSDLKLNLESHGYGFNPVIATGSGTMLNLTGKLSASDSSDGKNASDFTGLGTQIIANNGATVNVNNMNIYTKGFLHDAFIVDTHGKMTVSNSNITTMGANPLTQAWDGYYNSAIQSVMLSPPWVLGIMGGVRSGNMLGTNPTLTVLNSKITSGGWALLSTDSGQNAMMNVVNSDLTILPQSQGGMSSGNFPYSDRYGSGYGSYIIGNATENFYGVNIKGTTYAAILTGGTATYQSANQKITLKDADGGTVKTVQGTGGITNIDSVFGFMAHNNGAINVLDKTVVNSQEATFLCKNGDVTFTADDAKLNSRSGIILQMMDNDDTTVGVSGFGPGGPIFNTTFHENAGWPAENGGVTTVAPQDNVTQHMPWGDVTGPNYNTVNLNLTNGSYNGNVYNGTGYYNQVGDKLIVTIGKNGSLNGAISLTETRHVKEDGTQNTDFTINQYYYLGHVENKLYDNGNSKVNVTLTDGGVWTVSGTSMINSLTVGTGSSVTGSGRSRVQMTVDGVPTQIEPGHVYAGSIILTLVK